MDFIQFYGHKKTSNDFLHKVKNISKSTAQMLENLKSLSIFTDITQNKNKMFLKESPSIANVKMASTGQKKFSFNFPNILGRGEFLSCNFKTINDCGIEIGKPFIANNKIFKTNFSVNRTTKDYKEKVVKITKAELKVSEKNKILRVGTEKIHKIMIYYIGSDLNLLGFNLKSKSGITAHEENSPFFKSVISRSLNFNTSNIFFNSTFTFGKLLGKTTMTEKFFLGSRTRGYKPESISPISQNRKVGGNTFIEIRNKIGFFFKNFEIFTFADLAVNSSKGAKECLDLLYKFDDNSNTGRSVGFGIALKDKPGTSLIYSFPLTTNPETEKYSFGIDLEF